MSSMPEVGDKAPDFQGVDQNGKSIKLADLRGVPVALYFYPEDDTDLCTKQACNLRDNHKLLQKEGITVIGVSPDTMESHEAFAQKFNLPFSLIPDPQKKIMQAYGVWGEKNLYGNIVVGTKRTTFLIDTQGNILHVFKRPKTAKHAEEILSKYYAKA